MKRLGILGYPLSHSISPEFQQAALDHHKIKAEFHRWEIKTNELNSFFETFQDANFVGASVTIPYKEQCLDLVDKVSESANLIGAVNCIVNTNNQLVGHNTDGSGFIRALKTKHGFNWLKNFILDGNYIIHPEIIIYSEKFNLCGTIDLLIKNMDNNLINQSRFSKRKCFLKCYNQIWINI